MISRVPPDSGRILHSSSSSSRFVFFFLFPSSLLVCSSSSCSSFSSSPSSAYINHPLARSRATGVCSLWRLLACFPLVSSLSSFHVKGRQGVPSLPVSSLRKTNAISRSIANTPRRFSKHFGIIFLSTMIYAFRLPDRYIMVSYVRRRGELRPADAFDAFVYSRVTFMSESIPFWQTPPLKNHRTRYLLKSLDFERNNHLLGK